MDREQLIDRLRRDIGDHEPPVITAYLFGSWARGTARAGSDVDVAVLFAASRPRTLMGLPTELEASLSSSVGRNVQVIDLMRASPDLVHRVLRDGQLLLDRDPSARIRFEVHRRNQYFDVLPHLQRYRRRSA
jgi:predicted nucleotidyltransferase